MKITKEFAPITIVLEDKHDLEMLRKIIYDSLELERYKGGHFSHVNTTEKHAWAKKLLDL